jgi:Fe-S-cluster-containing dehydrogenase component
MEMTKNNPKDLAAVNAKPEYFESRGEIAPQELSVDEFLADEKLRETSTDRRDFLKFLGFSVAAATLAACEAPVTKAIPYVNKPEDVTPGLANWYASTYYDGNSYASILVKTREGRPIHIKGNRDFGITAGGINPQMAASVLSLYDGERLKSPLKNGEASTWSDVDAEIRQKLAEIKEKGGKIAIVSNTIISPSTLGVIADFTAEYGNVEHIQYDAVSYSGIRLANKASFDLDVIPSYDFSKADTIVSVGADFLNDWLLSNLYAVQYAANRKPEAGKMSKHFQFEAMMSLAGSNADYRGMVKPSQYAAVLATIAEGVGAGSVNGIDTSSVNDLAELKEAIKALKASKGKSLVVCGSNNKALQIITNKINHALGNYTSTINLNNPIGMFKSEDEKMMNFVKSVVDGKAPDAVIFYGTNPVYTSPKGAKLAEAIAKVGLTISTAGWNDETASRCQYVTPDHHALESWNDYAPAKNHYAIAQPTIKPLHNTAGAQESFLVWAGKAERKGRESKVYYDYIRSVWEAQGFARQTEYSDFHTFWNKAVHDSAITVLAETAESPAFITSLDGLSSQLPKISGDVEVVLYQKSSMGIGTQAGNPWLQEMPDPLSKVTWDNYITMNYAEAKKAGYNITMDQENGASLASVTVGEHTFELPVIPTPGQTAGTIGIALGYGRGEDGEAIGKAAFRTKEYGGYDLDGDKRLPIGKNAFRLIDPTAGYLAYDVAGSVKFLGGNYPIAATQFQLTAMGRTSIVKETTFDIFNKKESSSYNPPHMLMTHHGPEHVSKFDLWESHPVEHVGHRWALSIDLNSCLGCGTCLIACQSENNVPVVGKDEVRRGREMAWLRIDRYYKSEDELAIGTKKENFSYDGLEKNIDENPTVVFMPMMCQHCNHAPCETVCPVAATNHSNEGLNQMAYNRCIGTRYCANNCPYKVRRFNWFNYPAYKKFTEVNPAQDDLGRMVLNPDVTVRTRGVMEKCSMCVQKIQEGKLTAKSEGRPVVDGDVSVACADACPTNAITMGDWNDTHSAVREASEGKRAYQALEEIGVKPNIWYQVKVRNHSNEELDHAQQVKDLGHHESEGHDNGGH